MHNQLQNTLSLETGLRWSVSISSTTVTEWPLQFHPQVVPSSSKPVWMSLFCRTQRKIFWRKFVTRLFWGTIDFHSRKKNTLEVNGAPELLCFPHSSEYLPLCSAEQRHSYRFGNTWGWVNDNFHFWVNYPFKSLGYICSNSQKYIVWVKITDFSFMPKIIRILSKDHVPWRYFVNVLL